MRREHLEGFAAGVLIGAGVHACPAIWQWAWPPLWGASLTILIMAAGYRLAEKGARRG